MRDGYVLLYTMRTIVAAFLICITLGCKDSSESPATEQTVEATPEREATVETKRMHDLMVKYFKEERAVTSIGADGEPAQVALHRCPSEASVEEGNSAIVPPLAVDCSVGPEGKCVPADSPSKPYEYPKSAWSDPVFSALGFSQDQPHRFHYGVRSHSRLDGYGGCQFTVQAFGDLDGDGVFSTYERAAAADMHGVNTALEMYIDKRGE